MTLILVCRVIFYEEEAEEEKEDRVEKEGSNRKRTEGSARNVQGISDL